MRLLVISACMAGVLACGGGASRPAEPARALSGTWEPPAVLAHVPSDTPYLFATLEDIPRAWRDRMYASFDDRIREYTKTLEALPRDFDRSTLEPWMRAMFAIFDRLRDKDPATWTTELGLDRNGKFVLYGLSLWPVARITLAQPDKLRSFVEPALAASGWKWAEQALHGKPYWRVDDGDWTYVGAIIDHEAVFSVFPAAIASDILPLVLGVTAPERSLRDADTVVALMNKYGILASTIGFFDIRAITNIVTGRGARTQATLARPITAETAAIPPECRTELDRLVALVPRIVLGYRRLDARGMHFRLVVEMPPSVTNALGAIRTSVPEVTAGMSGHPLFALGIAASLDDAVPLVHGIANDVVDAPFQCEWFGALNRAAADVSARLAKPLPPILTGVRGLSLVVDELTRSPSVIEAHALVVGPHARDLLTLASAFMPALAMLQLPADGTPVPVPLTNLGMAPGTTAHVAATADRLAFAIGTNTEPRAAELVTRGAPRRSPLLSLAFDAVRMRELGAFDNQAGAPQLTQMRDVVMQVDVSRDGIVGDMYMAFPP
jgi:hypothetical protein